jgi:UPF0755 protein
VKKKQAEPKPKKQKIRFNKSFKKTLKLVITIIAALILLILAGTVYVIFVPVKTPEVIVRIRHGESTRSISKQLSDSKVIRSSFWFDILARLTKSDRKLKAGRYVFGGHVNLWQTIIKIRDGKSSLIHLTIPEGFSLYQILRRMESSGISSYDTLMTMATNPEIVKTLTGYNWPTLEGVLYPETYAFDVDLVPEQIFSLMISQFYKKLADSGITITNEKDFYRKLILASIVEKEAVLEGEKPLIAGLFLNRLNKGMRLESCPTIDYTMERQGIKKKQLSYKDLEIDTPYNTYKISGLPPNPICNPGITSLQAVLSPEVTEYLYFFADFEGRNIFSKTYREHINKQKIYYRQKP